MIRKVNIGLASDRNCVCGLLVTACSMAIHASREAELVYHVLDGGIDDVDFEFLVKRLGELHPRTCVIRHPVDKTLYADFPAWHGNRMTYARFMLCQALADEEFCIYSDVDFLWRRDVVELWKLRNADVAVQGCLDYENTRFNLEKKWAEAHRLMHDPNTYICAGFSFYNLKRMREEKIVERCSRFLLEHPDVIAADQSAINYVLSGKIRVLDKKYGMFLTEVPLQAENSLVNIHFAGYAPWRMNLFYETLTDIRMLWFRYYGFIYGKSIWWALRRHFSASRILLSRLSFLFLQMVRRIRFLNRIWRVRYVFEINPSSGLFKDSLLRRLFCEQEIPTGG